MNNRVNNREVKISQTDEIQSVYDCYLSYFGELVNDPDHPDRPIKKTDIDPENFKESFFKKIKIFLKLSKKIKKSSNIDYINYNSIPTYFSNSKSLNKAYQHLREYETARAEAEIGFFKKIFGKKKKIFQSNKIKKHHFYIAMIIGKKIEDIAKEEDIGKKIELIEKTKNFIFSLQKNIDLVEDPINKKYTSLPIILDKTTILLSQERKEREKSILDNAFVHSLKNLESLREITDFTQSFLLRVCTTEPVPENVFTVLTAGEESPTIRDETGISSYFDFSKASHEEYKKHRDDLPSNDAKKKRFTDLLKEKNHYDFIQRYFIRPLVATNYIRKHSIKDGIDENIQSYLDEMRQEVTVKDLESFSLGSSNKDKKEYFFSEDILKLIANIINYKNRLLELEELHFQINSLATLAGNSTKLYIYDVIKEFISKLQTALHQLKSSNDLLHELMLDHNTKKDGSKAAWQDNIHTNYQETFNTTYKKLIDLTTQLFGSMELDVIEADQKKILQAIEDIKPLCKICNIAFTTKDEKRSADLLQATGTAATQIKEQTEQEEPVKQEQSNSASLNNIAPFTVSSLPDPTISSPLDPSVSKAEMIGSLHNQIQKLQNGFDRYTCAYINRIKQTSWLTRLFSRHGQTGIKNALDAKAEFHKKIIGLKEEIKKTYQEDKSSSSILSSLDQSQAEIDMLNKFIKLTKQQIIALPSGNLNHHSYKTYLIAYINKLEKIKCLAEMRAKLSSTVCIDDDSAKNVFAFETNMLKDKNNLIGIIEIIEQVMSGGGFADTVQQHIDQEKLQKKLNDLKTRLKNTGTQQLSESAQEEIKVDKGFKSLEKLLVKGDQTIFHLFKHKKQDKLDQFQLKNYQKKNQEEKMALYREEFWDISR
jgi:hypothetical protein